MPMPRESSFTCLAPSRSNAWARRSNARASHEVKARSITRATSRTRRCPGTDTVSNTTPMRSFSAAALPRASSRASRPSMRALPAVEPDEPEQRLDGGRFARAVLAHETDDLALAHREAHVLQGESRVVLGHVPRLDERRGCVRVQARARARHRVAHRVHRCHRCRHLSSFMLVGGVRCPPRLRAERYPPPLMPDAPRA